MTVKDLSFVHRFEAGAAHQSPLLLPQHGTGGDEADLLQLGRRIAPDASLLSPRGQVLEGGMPRFFRRHAEGVFDEDDLQRRTDDLAAFVADARAAYGLTAPIAVGFSNGANHRGGAAAAAAGRAFRRGAAARDAAVAAATRG